MTEFEVSADKVIQRMVGEIIKPFHEGHIDGFTTWWKGQSKAKREAFVSEVQPTMCYSITELYQQRGEHVRMYCNKSSLVPTYICPENTVVYVAEHLPAIIAKMTSPNWASMWLREKIMWMRDLINASVPFREGLEKSQFWPSIIEEGGEHGEFASFIQKEQKEGDEEKGEEQEQQIVQFMKFTDKEKADPEQLKFFEKQMQSCAFAWKGETDFVLNVYV